MFILRGRYRKNHQNVRNKCYNFYNRSKKHLVWEFTIDDESHRLEMYDSLLSGKKKIIKDNQVIKEEDGFIKVLIN